jgi:hypothetical protein
MNVQINKPDLPLPMAVPGVGSVGLPLKLAFARSVSTIAFAVGACRVDEIAFRLRLRSCLLRTTQPGFAFNGSQRMN